jgi:hypothetical protein
MRAILGCKPQRQICVSSLVFILLIFLSAEARADVFGFSAISNTSGLSDELAQQLCVDVTYHGELEDGTDQVLFTFYNNPDSDLGSDFAEFYTPDPLASSIADVYFDDGSLLGIADIFNGGPGVSFSDPAVPEDLPGGNSIEPPFETTAGFSADSDTPVQPMGVNPDEFVGILFNLQPGRDFGDVLAAIYQGFDDPLGGESLRIGLHLQAIGPESGSDSFTMTPVPGAVILGLLGLSVAGIKLRKFA